MPQYNLNKSIPVNFTLYVPIKAEDREEFYKKIAPLCHKYGLRKQVSDLEELTVYRSYKDSLKVSVRPDGITFIARTEYMKGRLLQLMEELYGPGFVENLQGTKH
jgi:hypothetical protein